MFTRDYSHRNPVELQPSYRVAGRRLLLQQYNRRIDKNSTQVYFLYDGNTTNTTNLEKDIMPHTWPARGSSD